MWVHLATSTIRTIIKKCRHVREISTKLLRNSITSIKEIMDQFTDNGPDIDWNSKVRRGVLEMISCYRENSRKDYQFSMPTS
jgi:hypothetical protein